MVTLVKLLDEVSNKYSSEHVSDEFAEQWIAENYVSASTNIYKGLQNIHPDFNLFSKKDSFTRTSLNTSNHYTTLLDNLQSWKNYPKRSKSLICTTSPQVARSYGYQFRCIPRKGSIFGICPNLDIWVSFKKFLSIVEDIEETRITTLDDFNNMFSENEIRENDYAGMMEADGEYYNNVIADYMTPEFNGFQLQQYPFILHENTVNGFEVWFNDDCLLIDEIKFKKIIREKI